jgi:hypothetical protein
LIKKKVNKRDFTYTEGYMDEENKKPLGRVALVGALFLSLLLLTAFIPARWVGLEPKVSGYTPIDFSSIKPAEEVLKESDRDNNGTVTWRELFEANLPERETLQLEATTPDPKIQKALDDPNNLTASFSKNLIVSSAYLKNNNITDPDAQKAVIDGITQEEINKTASKTYTLNEIKIAKSEDLQSIRAYGNQMATILKNIITVKDLETNLPGVMDYINTENEKSVDPIKKTATYMENVVGKLLLVEVPPSAALYHISVLNQAVMYKDVVSNISKIIDDPVRASISVEKYPETTLDTLRVFITLKNYFSVQKITFTSSEAGYVFITGYTLK